MKLQDKIIATITYKDGTSETKAVEPRKNKQGNFFFTKEDFDKAPILLMAEQKRGNKNCKCIEKLVKLGYVQPNLLKSGQYFIYPLVNRKVGKGALLIQYCPICGKHIREG